MIWWYPNLHSSRKRLYFIFVFLHLFYPVEIYFPVIFSLSSFSFPFSIFFFFCLVIFLPEMTSADIFPHLQGGGEKYLHFCPTINTLSNKNTLQISKALYLQVLAFSKGFFIQCISTVINPFFQRRKTNRFSVSFGVSVCILSSKVN